MMLAHATCRLHIDVHGSKSIHTELFVLMIQGGAQFQQRKHDMEPPVHLAGYIIWLQFP